MHLCMSSKRHRQVLFLLQLGACSQVKSTNCIKISTGCYGPRIECRLDQQTRGMYTFAHEGSE
jgi:hypothetical protein